jgi:hypothetical protein
VVKKSKRATSRSKKPPKTERAKNKIEKTMSEFKHGELHSGSKQGPMVTNRRQAVAIALSQARKTKSKGRRSS